jgi:hypothetical protein
LESLELEGSGSLVLTDWSADSPSAATMSILVTESAVPGAYDLVANDGMQEVQGFVVYGVTAPSVAVADSGITAGDSVFVPLVSSGLVFDEETVTLEGDDEIDIVGWTYIDANCVVAELAVSDGAFYGSHMLTLGNGSAEMPVVVLIEESIL